MRKTVFVALAAIFALLSYPAGPAGATTHSYAERVLARVNQYRANHGLAPVALDRRLAQAAQAHSEDMAKRDFFEHEGSDGSEMPERLARAGYFYRVAAENIAAGLASPEKTVDRWMSSEGHRRNILIPEIREVGVGYVYLREDRGAAQYHHYWTLTLGAQP